MYVLHAAKLSQSISRRFNFSKNSVAASFLSRLNIYFGWWRCYLRNDFFSCMFDTKRKFPGKVRFVQLIFSMFRFVRLGNKKDGAKHRKNQLNKANLSGKLSLGVKHAWEKNHCENSSATSRKICSVDAKKKLIKLFLKKLKRCDFFPFDFGKNTQHEKHTYLKLDSNWHDNKIMTHTQGESKN